jgi:hypothetical protein
MSRTPAGIKAVGEVFEETSLFIRGFIGEVAQAPLHLIDNEYITRGYRIGYTRSIKQILRSLFEFHNESVNVWSHLLGMLFFSWMIIYTLYQISNFKDFGSVVWNGLQEARAGNLPVTSYF